MTQKKKREEQASLLETMRSLSPRRFFGFSCNQGFMFFLFYTGLNRSFSFGELSFERVDLMGTLLFMVISFLVLKKLISRIPVLVSTPPFLFLYALMLVLGSLTPYFFETSTFAWLIAEVALTGISLSFLLLAWGVDFGRVSTKISVPEVFVGSLLGALFGFLVSFIPLSEADLAFRILPFLSALMLSVGSVREKQGAAKESTSMKHAVLRDGSNEDTALISVKVMAGTVLFGVAAGLMETFNTEPGMPIMQYYALAFILFISFSLGTLSLLLSDSFGKGAALNKAYRLALFIMLMGLLLVSAPFPHDSIVSGEAVVLAGYLSLTAVLISLFLVLAALTGTSTSLSFSRGFAALFGGEVLGIFLANLTTLSKSSATTSYYVVVFAGLLVLFSYLFLFTERDFENLSEIVTSTDSFEDLCQEIAEEFGLSNREAEILPFALRGRTSERISDEFYISKSTVDTHLRRIYSKVGVHSRQELIDLGERSKTD